MLHAYNCLSQALRVGNRDSCTVTNEVHFFSQQCYLLTHEAVTSCILTDSKNESLVFFSCFVKGRLCGRNFVFLISEPVTLQKDISRLDEWTTICFALRES